jgi:putative toxin-antitoxin system antitoxin component (TIGR02293 family)
MTKTASSKRTENTPPKRKQHKESNSAVSKTLKNVTLTQPILTWEPGAALPESKNRCYSLIEQAARVFNLGRKQIEKIFGISVRSQYRYIESNVVLNQLQQDRLARFNRVVRHTLEVFEDQDASYRWLATPKVALGGEVPLDLLATDEGTEQVEQMLYQAEYGVFA